MVIAGASYAPGSMHHFPSTELKVCQVGKLLKLTVPLHNIIISTEACKNEGTPGHALSLAQNGGPPTVAMDTIACFTSVQYFLLIGHFGIY